VEADRQVPHRPETPGWHRPQGLRRQQDRQANIQTDMSAATALVENSATKLIVSPDLRNLSR
jgi:hypothetical protein